MIELSYPFVLVLLLVPILFYFWAYRLEKNALYFGNFDMLRVALNKDKNSKLPTANSTLLQKIILILVYTLMVIALAKPILVEEPIVQEKSLREILICIDLSQSMEVKDFKSKDGEMVDRLQAQKEVLNDFFDTLSDENFALVFYGSSAFVQTPFTNDTKITKILLDEAIIGMAGPKTVIGDAIGLGIKLFDEQETKDRLIILMSDGSDTNSLIPPIEAAEIAKQNNIKIQTIAVGNPDTDSEDKVDVGTLKSIAKITGGDFYLASDTDSLREIYTQIYKLNPKIVEVTSHRPTKELFRYFVLIALSILLLYSFILVLKRTFWSKDA